MYATQLDFSHSGYQVVIFQTSNVTPLLHVNRTAECWLTTASRDNGLTGAGCGDGRWAVKAQDTGTAWIRDATSEIAASYRYDSSLHSCVTSHSTHVTRRRCVNEHSLYIQFYFTETHGSTKIQQIKQNWTNIIYTDEKNFDYWNYNKVVLTQQTSPRAPLQGAAAWRILHPPIHVNSQKRQIRHMHTVDVCFNYGVNYL